MHRHAPSSFRSSIAHQIKPSHEELLGRRNNQPPPQPADLYVATARLQLQAARRDDRAQRRRDIFAKPGALPVSVLADTAMPMRQGASWERFPLSRHALGSPRGRRSAGASFTHPRPRTLPPASRLVAQPGHRNDLDDRAAYNTAADTAPGQPRRTQGRRSQPHLVTEPTPPGSTRSPCCNCKPLR